MRARTTITRQTITRDACGGAYGVAVNNDKVLYAFVVTPFGENVFSHEQTRKWLELPRKNALHKLALYVKHFNKYNRNVQAA